MIGSWNIVVSDKMPQKVASAFSNLSNELLGAEYTFISYLGSQIVNGTNHAVIAEQLVLAGKDTKNIVLIIFNEKGNEVTLVNIERIVESGGELGGVTLNVQRNLPDDAQQAYNEVIEGFVGSAIKPIVYFGSQITKGTDYIFAAVVTSISSNPTSKVVLMTINPFTKSISFKDILNTPINTLGYAFKDTLNTPINTLGYAFTW